MKCAWLQGSEVSLGVAGFHGAQNTGCQRRADTRWQVRCAIEAVVWLLTHFWVLLVAAMRHA